MVMATTPADDRLPGKACPKKCGKSVCLVPVAKSSKWVALETKADQGDGEWVVVHGEATQVRPGERTTAWRFRMHECAKKPPPQSVPLDLFGESGPPVHSIVVDEFQPPDAFIDPADTTDSPPIVGSNDPLTSQVAAQRIEPVVGTRRAAVLDLLRRNAASDWPWCNAAAILLVGGTEGLRRLRELRQMGWNIATRPDPDSDTGWQYRLVKADETE